MKCLKFYPQLFKRLIWILLFYRNEWIGGAVLDLFKTEPLPQESPLWTLPNVIITPHIAGPSYTPDVSIQHPRSCTLQTYNMRHPRDIWNRNVVWRYQRRVWRYQRGNQNLYIEEEQTTQWPKQKVQKDKQRSTKHTHKIKDWVTRTPLKTSGELRCSGKVSSSCSTSGTCHVNLVTILVISHEWGKDWEVFTTSGTYLWSFVTQI